MAAQSPDRNAVFASVAHLTRSGDMTTTSFDTADLDELFDGIKLLLQDWDSSRDDTTVIRIMSADEHADRRSGPRSPT